jgi:rubrerythrin
MSKQLIDILKEGILLERRGRALYQQAAKLSTNTAVRDFFQMMADEEEHHARILERQFKAYSEQHQLADLDADTADQKTSVVHALIETLRANIAPAGFEGAAISAAMLIEERSVNLYSDRARLATDPREKALFRWLAEWEHDHLTFLVGLERDIREQVWNDRRFWPF